MEFHVEHVPCCGCGSSGKVKKLIFWERDCRLCEGSGQRPIFMSKALSPADMAWVRASAMTTNLTGLG